MSSSTLFYSFIVFSSLNKPILLINHRVFRRTKARAIDHIILILLFVTSIFALSLDIPVRECHIIVGLKFADAYT